jgi:N-acyl-L-homoserine lactone synthetase
MSIEFAGQRYGTKLRINDYLPEIDYRIALSEQELDDVYALRYRSYLRERSIDPNPAERFSDDYDRMDNCWIAGVYADDAIVGSIRIHVLSPQNRKGVAADVFPDIIHPLIDKGKVIVDPTRFVCDVVAKRKYPELAYITLRVPSMASLAFDADYCLATVKESHRAFYEHIFEAKVLSDARPYPGLRHRLCLMQVDIDRVRDQLMQRHQAFRTTVAEWRMFFEQTGILRDSLRGVLHPETRLAS